MSIRLASTAQEFERCFSVLVQLRPSLTLETFLGQLERMREATGFQLAFSLEGDAVRGVAGFRVAETFALGRHLYVDDLVVDSERRSLGVGAALFDWLAAHGRSEGCSALVLDSGVQRSDAHRFYFLRRMKIAAYSFELVL